MIKYILTLTILAGLCLSCKKDYQCDCTETKTFSENMSTQVYIEYYTFEIKDTPSKAETSCLGNNLYDATPDNKNNVKIECTLIN
ncbi:hypothetical protein DNU06_14555 [Putridiphycobacter roseus]|uniref:Uncharacterized protein n=1 Tax=Putridiphycobacter roseus TaxID=2219161 RepID=A0A2W1MYA9_9FLAO|nr:hypothetical protein [Putridiphycobacter roseus]PZE16180.1 hypothetical protein DNU06_14555 [Putridiphycobacter roseus]